MHTSCDRHFGAPASRRYAAPSRNHGTRIHRRSDSLCACSDGLGSNYG